MYKSSKICKRLTDVKYKYYTHTKKDPAVLTVTSTSTMASPRNAV